ncbi:unnamed protein product [Mytilus coruscus]|uniref:Uncharacterized protein n=1 Tax=Mytilus coruscus TaxID=42192 RepID=A0A6J8DB63_MYTCO|nr:unnamed protein product [Mytilus coruscus]
MTKSNTLEPPNMASYADGFKNGPKSDESDFISSVKPVFSQESDLFGSDEKERKLLLSNGLERREYNEDDTNNYLSHHSNSDNSDDINRDEIQQLTDSAQPDDLSNYTIDQSQSILTTANETNVALQNTDSPAARPKDFPARKTGPTNKLTNPDPAKQTRNTGQSQMTQFMHVTNQESRPTRKMRINKSIRQQNQHLDVALKSHQ